MKSKLIVIGLVLTLLVGGMAPSFAGRAGAAYMTTPAVSPAQTHVAEGKIKFAFHAGLAFFAFHHYVYNRYKKHEFDAGAHFRKIHLVEAGIALLFTYHELKVALADANGSNSPVLHKLVSPLNALIAKYNGAVGRVNSGNVSGTDFQTLNSSTSAFSNQSSHAGYQITDVPVTVPGA